MIPLPMMNISCITYKFFNYNSYNSLNIVLCFIPPIVWIKNPLMWFALVWGSSSLESEFLVIVNVLLFLVNGLTEMRLTSCYIEDLT